MQDLDRRGFLGLMGSGAAGLPLSKVFARGRRGANFVFILTDDQRYDAVGYAGKSAVMTPHIDALANRGMKFGNAFVVLSICSPCRAACLTGRYGSSNGVLHVGSNPRIKDGVRTFAQYLKEAGYSTGMVGKWHLSNSPQWCGFDFVTHFMSNGPQWNRKVNEHGKTKTAEGFIEDYNAEKAIEFIDKAKSSGSPFVLFLCTQLAHMDHEFDWKPRPETLAKYADVEIEPPQSWQDDLEGKPEYLKNDRSRKQALKYGYDKAENIREHFRKYYASVTDMDAALGRVIKAVEDKGLADNTFFLFMGDNGWFMGEHGFTSKVLAYEESIRVPMFATGPGIKAGTSDRLVLNIDWAPTIMELAGLEVPADMQGNSLVPLLKGGKAKWRESFLYEAPVPCLGSRPLLAVRTDRWKLITTFETKACSNVVFEELYDLKNDPAEMKNLAADSTYTDVRANLAKLMTRHREAIK